MHVNLDDVGKSAFNSIFAACLAGMLLATGCSRGVKEQSKDSAGIRDRPVATDSKPQGEVDSAIGSEGIIPAGSPVIVTFGDSLTAGVSGRSYPDQLQELLLKRGYKYRIDNQGVSGDTTTDGLARIGNVIAAHPALVILEFGGNDGLRGVPVDATRKNLGEMITQIQRARLPLVLLGITLPPNYGMDYVRPFTAMFPALGKQYHIPVMPFLLLNVYQHNDMMQPDGIHPNGSGNSIVAQDVFALIQPMLIKK